MLVYANVYEVCMAAYSANVHQCSLAYSATVCHCVSALAYSANVYQLQPSVLVYVAVYGWPQPTVLNMFIKLYRLQPSVLVLGNN